MAVSVPNTPKTKYLLLALVALIWGIILVRIISGLSSDSPVVVSTKPVSLTKVAEISDSFSLINQYPDPFLTPLEQLEEDTVEEKKVTSTPVQNSNTIAPAATPIPNPPNIIYKGFLQKSSKGPKTAIININGNEALFLEKDKIAEKTVLYKITENSITVEFYGKMLKFNLGG